MVTPAALHPHLLTEAQLLSCVKDAARKFNWLTYHTYRSDHSEAGFPDLVLVRGAWTLFVELKGYDTKGRLGKVSATQEKWLAALHSAGQMALTWTPEMWFDDQILKILR